MRAKEAIKLVAKSIELEYNKHTLPLYVLHHDYSVWLAFANKYRDVDYETHKKKLEELQKRYERHHG